MIRKKVDHLGPQLEADYANQSGVGVPPAWSLQKLRIYVPGPEGTAGTMEFNPQQSFDNAESALVYHYDHLGSIERITPHGSTSTTYVLDGQGKPSRYSYDAWGQRRNADTWSGAPTTTADGGSDDATPRGYTGHEMLDDLGLVHMNGRIYDPLLGRFLSADLIVSDSRNLQSFNRYSYVENRPLSANDPSGFVLNFVGDARNQAHVNTARQRDTRIDHAFRRLEASSHVFVVADFGNIQPRDAPRNTEIQGHSRTGIFVAESRDASNGVGAGGTIYLNPANSDAPLVVTHEGAGHAYDAEHGTLDNTPIPGSELRTADGRPVRRSEENGFFRNLSG